MNDTGRDVDSKGSSDPSESGVRNNLKGIIFWVLGFMVLALVVFIGAIHSYSHTQKEHKNPGATEPAAPSTQPH